MRVINETTDKLRNVIYHIVPYIKPVNAFVFQTKPGVLLSYIAVRLEFYLLDGCVDIGFPLEILAYLAITDAGHSR
jgi:hypothetical protein